MKQKKTGKQNKCFFHAHEDSKAVCLSCGRSVCQQCINVLAGKNYCPDCTASLIKEAVNVVFIQSEGIGIERRKYTRINLLHSVEIHSMDSTEKFGKGIIISISVGDVGLIMDKSLKENMIVRLNLELPDKDEILSLQGGVVRTEKVGDKYFIGITFMNLGNDFDKLKEFIDSKLKKRFIKLNDKISFV